MRAVSVLLFFSLLGPSAWCVDPRDQLVLQPESNVAVFNGTRIRVPSYPAMLLLTLLYQARDNAMTYDQLNRATYGLIDRVETWRLAAYKFNDRSIDRVGKILLLVRREGIYLNLHDIDPTTKATCAEWLAHLDLFTQELAP
ncbi:MAG: hypothetical protein KF799_12850 [Bdellovibrionales bacterium]|nr:hypothetical protein [Bdellovibrionales bacterium]